ncbi:MAG: hypothetical protein JWN44_5379 [Myxococcales bacterium]|nr:hypothetical protein [Myxococcales bacterium]
MRTLLAAFLLMSAVARAGEALSRPPDVLHGERYDGRNVKRPARDYLLVVPRLLLVPPRLLMLGLGAVAKPALEWNERKHVAERVVAALTSSDGLVGVRPVFNYELNFRPSFGALYFNDRLPRGAHLTASTAIGGPETILQSAHVTVPLMHGRAAVDVDTTYRRRNDELYTGIGMHNPLPFARYATDQADAAAVLSLRPLHPLRVELGVDVGIRRFADGEPYGGDRKIGEVYCIRGVAGRCLTGAIDERLAPGFGAGTQFARETVAVHLDSRRDETSAGLLVDASAQYTHGLGADASSYVRLHGHAGTSFEIWRHRALYLGVSADDIIAFGSTPVPFSELVVLGGPEDLRGFQRGRFRDASSLVATVEYRWPIWMWMDGSLFFDYGGVFGPAFSRFAVGDLRPDLGLGLRVHSSSKFVMRIQVAYGFGSEGGIRLVIAGNGNPS